MNYKHLKGTFFAVIVSVLFSSSALYPLGKITTNINVFVSPNHKKVKGTRYVILPVEMKAAWLQTPKNAKRKLMFENRNYEKIEMSLLTLGARVLERSKIDKIIKEQGFGQTGLTEDNGVKIGRLLNAKYVVFCSIIDFGVIGSNAITELAIKAINIQDGSIVWKAMLSGKIQGTTDDFSNSAMETQVYNDFTGKLKKHLKN